MLESALEYARDGFLVFPVKVRGKQPLARSSGGVWMATHGLNDATTDPITITRWWTAEPLANIGARTGLSFDVCDVDEEGMVAFQALAAEHELDLLTLVRVKTGGGGRHIYFEKTGFGNRAGLIPGVDWRGAGGYVLLPPSIHPNGEPYEWILRLSAPLTPVTA